MINKNTVELEFRGYPQQTDLIFSDAPVAAFIGGLGSGKSHAGALKSLKYCLQHPGAKGIVTAPTYKMVDEVVIPKYELLFPTEFVRKKVSKPYPKWILANGSEIHFWSTTRPEVIAGIEIAFAHMDEGSLSPYEAFGNIKKRLRQIDKDGKTYPYQIWITTTPRQLNWLYVEITRKENPIQVIQATTFDNKYLFADDPTMTIDDYVNAMGLSGKEYEQEILGQFVSLAGECLFSRETLERCLAECVQPIEVRENGTLQVWREPVVGNRYVAAADCADEGGEGVNILIIMDAVTGVEAAEICADISADEFSSMAYELLEDYWTPLLAIERNGVGNAVVQKFRDMGYKNMYKDERGKHGWYTTPVALPPKVSRFTMLAQYEEALRLRRTTTFSSDAVGEMSTFVLDSKGKYKHRQGCRDDRVMARAICWQMMKVKDRNIKSFISFTRKASSYEPKGSSYKELAWTLRR